MDQPLYGVAYYDEYIPYDRQVKSFIYPYTKGKELLSNAMVSASEKISLQPWYFQIIEE